jgi:hypothetical protein
MMFVPHRKHGLLRESFTFLYVDDVRTSLEELASTACYWDSFTFSYVDDVRTSQEAHLWSSTARYGDNFTLLCVACQKKLGDEFFPELLVFSCMLGLEVGS